jgi:hypothetical protein
MLVSGPAAAAMQAACDFAIPDAMFLDEALGLSEGEGEGDNIEQPSALVNTDGLRERMETIVRRVLAASNEPVSMARAAHEVRRSVGSQVDSTSWGGSGSFGRFVADIAGDHLRIDTTKSPGWIYDPARHAAPVGGMSRIPPDVPEVAERVSRIVGTPLLSSDTYATLFDVLVTDGRSAAGSGNAAAERVTRDVCGQRGMPVSRAAVRFVLVGYQYGHVEWTNPELDAVALAEAFTGNVLRLARDAQMDLSADEEAQIRSWIAGQRDRPAVP